MQYFFILGRNPELSLAELHAVLPAGYKALACSREVLIMECRELEVEKLMKRLGGTVKIGEITPFHNPRQLPLILRGRAQSKKLFLGFSAYALGDRVRLPTVRELRGIGMELKRALQTPSQSPLSEPDGSPSRRPWKGGERRGVRLVTSRERALSSVIVKKEKLLSQGAEIVLLYSPPKDLLGPIGPNRSRAFSPLFIGKTLAVQEFEEASTRDFGRPVREMKVGILPIQLAKIMINLASAPLDATILDPFCGFGTILAEASLMGYRDLIGSDIERGMVDASRENLQWLFSNSHLPAENRVPQNRMASSAVGEAGELENVKLLVTPTEQLSKHLPPHSVNTIVTEPYLGPTHAPSPFPSLEGRGLRGGWNNVIAELSQLYINSFKEFSKILKPGGRVVFIFPIFKTGAQLTKTSAVVLPKIKNLGFTPIPLLPNNLITQSLNNSTSITYSRSNQRVLREIFVFELKP